MRDFEGTYCTRTRGEKLERLRWPYLEACFPRKYLNFRAFPNLFCSQDIFSKLIRISSVVGEVQRLQGKKASDAIRIME